MNAMTDFLSGYVVAAGAGLAGDLGRKAASRQPAGGTLSVLRPASAPGCRGMCMTGTRGVSTCHPARCVRCGGKGSGAPAGSFVFLLPGRLHRFWAAGRPARLLLIAVPGGIEGYFRKTSAASGDDERNRIGERHDIGVVPR
jgi:hypothetical protein